MRGYDEEEVEYYDDYEEDGEEQDDYADDKEEYEEEEDPKPTKEELEYLELRQRLKETGSALNKSQENKRKFPYDNSGSFFGPSQPVIAQRVIQESKSFLETQHLTPRVSNPYNSNKKSSASNAAGSKAPLRDRRPKVVNEVQKKAQRVKDTRDYSFLLSEDAELPAPTKEPLHRNVSAPNSDARSAQAPMKSKQSLGGNNGRHLHGGLEERRSVSLNGQMHSKAGSNKFSSGRPNSRSINSRKQLGSNNGNGPGRPEGPKGLPLKTPAVTMEKKPSAPSAKNFVSGVHKPLSSKMPSSVPKQPLERKKESREPNKGQMLSKQTIMSSKPQIHKPQKQISSRVTLQDNRPKKKPVRCVPCEDDEDDETKNASSIIRSMFKTQRFAGRDDDDRDMEANFEGIMREEKRMEAKGENLVFELNKKIYQHFEEFLTRVTKLEKLVDVGSTLLAGFQQGLDFLRRPQIKSGLLVNIIKANETKRVKSYLEAGCINTNDCAKNLSKLGTCQLGLQEHISKARMILNELECLLEDVAGAVQTANGILLPLQDKEFCVEFDQQATLNDKEETASSDIQKHEVTDYAALMAIIYSMVKQDYAMQERIVSSLNLKSSSGELESYCLMWSLRPYINDEIMHQAWRLIP